MKQFIFVNVVRIIINFLMNQLLYMSQKRRRLNEDYFVEIVNVVI